MKLITKNTDYAIRALMVLGAYPGQYVSARQVSREQGIPYQYVRKILQKLMQESMVSSRDGGNGGFTLKLPPRKLKVTDIIRVFQGNIQLSECMVKDKLCPRRPGCVLRKNIMRIEKIVEKEFSNITLESMLKEMKGTR